MVRTRFLATVVLIGLLAACGDDLADPPGPAQEAPEPVAAQPTPEPPAASPADEDEEFEVPDVWCGTDRVGFGAGPAPGDWEKLESGLWRRVHSRWTKDGEVWVVVWGRDRDGRFVTWEEVIDSGKRPLWGTPPIPDRPRERPPR